MAGDEVSFSFDLSRKLINNFRQALLTWGAKNIRSYPWRYLLDPYPVIVSEFMLHRTQTRQVIPIYEEFISLYPTLQDLGQADRQEAEKILWRLGLHWRIKGMLDVLETFWRVYSEIPTDYEKLVSVPTVGQYIAGAVICFTTNRPLILIDSNIVRVVGRVFGLDLRGEARRKKPVIDAITAVVDPDHPRDFYYAIIDLAHASCRPRDPECLDCPLLSLPCKYGKEEMLTENSS